MEKTGNSVKLNNSEKKILKKLIDRKYGKVTTAIDFESTGGFCDFGIEADIFNRIGKRLSGSTIERIIGLTLDQRNIRITSMEILSEYLDFKGVDQLISYLEINSFRTQNERANFDSNTFMKSHILKIVYGDNKEMSIRYLEANKFEVVLSKNSRLIKGDSIEVNQLELEEELICRSVYRIKEKKITNLGAYKSGENNKVKSIVFLK
jgi:hypothetical protein